MSSEWLPEVRGDAVRALSVLRAVQNDKRKLGTEQLCKKSLANASGVAFLFNFRMGVGITLGGGRGFVMSRLPNGGWSAPLFITVDQVGLGLTLGLSEVESVIVLDKPHLVDWFSTQGVGVSAEATIAEPLEAVGGHRNANDLAHDSTFRFSTAHGAIVDFSAQGSAYLLASTKNAGVYGQQASVKDILGGQVIEQV
ncbi:hypothetical protein COHA_003163 [Chlorella ohadii]|uniref:Ysc84 actin-binding domain-containing protein n=1 Tax=Chlorella ohadii TaxID=2649997 RepID=A0AAD5DW66_9CHLO|nr:hypothetical protein COHA_003163 [Chlorella ohadii]